MNVSRGGTRKVARAAGFVLAILVCWGGAALGRPSGGFEYFPLSAGRWWKYQAPQDRTVASCVKTQDSRRFYIQEYNDDFQVGGGQYAIQGGWLLRFSDDSRGHADWNPPARWLPVPLRVGSQWEFSFGLGTCANKVERQEVVTVPAGRFTCLRVRRSWNRHDHSTPTVVTEWYARNVGLVKSTRNNKMWRELTSWGLRNPPRAEAPSGQQPATGLLDIPDVGRWR